MYIQISTRTTTFTKGYKATLYSDWLRAPRLSKGQCEYSHYTLVFDTPTPQDLSSLKWRLQLCHWSGLVYLRRMTILFGWGPTSYTCADRPKESHLLHHQSYVESEASSMVVFSHRLRLSDLVSTWLWIWERWCPLLTTRFCTTLRGCHIFSTITLFVLAWSTLDVFNLHVAWWFLAQWDRSGNHVRPIR